MKYLKAFLCYTKHSDIVCVSVCPPISHSSACYMLLLTVIRNAFIDYFIIIPITTLGGNVIESSCLLNIIFLTDAVNVELDFISSIPVGEIRCARLTATFTSSEILEMMWLKRDGNTTKSIKVDNEKYSETTYSSRQEMHLFIHDVNESDAGSYWVIVKTTSGIGISRPGTLDVLHGNIYIDVILMILLPKFNMFLPFDWTFLYL